jgi:hypothetical protein
MHVPWDDGKTIPSCLVARDFGGKALAIVVREGRTPGQQRVQSPKTALLSGLKAARRLK